MSLVSVLYVSRIRPVCLIPLSILHRSHLVRILNITVGCMADAWRFDPITPPHRDHIVTSPRPHNTLTKPDLSSSAISARWASLSKNLEL